MQGKIKKYERDTRDYQFDRVYMWAEDRAQYRRRRNQRQDLLHTDRSSTESEDTSSNASTNAQKILPKRDFLAKGSNISSSTSDTADQADTISSKT